MCFLGLICACTCKGVQMFLCTSVCVPACGHTYGSGVLWCRSVCTHVHVSCVCTRRGVSTQGLLRGFLRVCGSCTQDRAVNIKSWGLGCREGCHTPWHEVGGPAGRPGGLCHQSQLPGKGRGNGGAASAQLALPTSRLQPSIPCLLAFSRVVQRPPAPSCPSAPLPG